MNPKKCKNCGEVFTPTKRIQPDCSPKCESERKALTKKKTRAKPRPAKKKNVSAKLRKSARGRDCTFRLDGCQNETETTVLCHLPCGQSGVGIKAPDYASAFGCGHCHDIIDKRKSGEFTGFDLMRAHIETMIIWVDEGYIKVD